MAIHNSDVKLFESLRLTDGGSRVTVNEVIDGNVNNLFQDISRIDRTVDDEKRTPIFSVKVEIKGVLFFLFFLRPSA